jgi:transcription elongation GreA/GreB family factor
MSRISFPTPKKPAREAAIKEQTQALADIEELQRLLQRAVSIPSYPTEKRTSSRVRVQPGPT